ncbi:MAG: bifunctional metallophosphatase/5'-nucleotidase [Bacteroidetes bacterium]|nr:bifunctional metallophosphatase/5'-nucleotidase [Bacteroidota bacterium]
MRTIILFLVLTSLLTAQQQELTVVHWNDFHSQNLPYQVKSRNRATNTDTTFMVGGSATLASYLKKHTASPNTLLLNCGDDFQGSPISAITKGRSQMELMALLKPHAMQLGNHEFDYGREVLASYFPSAPFPILSANIVDTKTNTTFGAPYLIKNVNGISIAVIGLMSPELMTLSLPDNVKGLEIRDPAAAVNALVPELKSKKVDMIVALSHMGVDEDSLLAVRCPDLDLIIGGHSHTPLFRPKKVNGIIIAQAGSRGRWIGKIALTVDVAKDTILSSNGELIECRTADIAPDTAVAAKVAQLESLAAAELSEVIGELKTDWKKDGRGESNIGNWIADALRTYAKADVGVQNSGGIRKEMLAGPIAVRDLWEISPFGNTLVTFTVTGAVLRSMVQHQLTINDDFCQVSGMKIVYRTVNGARLLHNLKVNNQLVKDEAVYTIATNNYVAAQAKKYFGLDLAPEKVKQYTVTDREVLIAAVRAQKVISSVVEGRIKETEE